jgi:hypothetical protein
MLVLKKAWQPTSDFDDKLGIVRDRVGAYTNALVAEGIRKAKDDEILHWIWLKEKEFLKPLDQESVGNTCRWFFASQKYKDFADSKASAVVCSGKGNFLYVWG